MTLTIRPFQTNDKQEIISMMEEFYSSDAVSTNGSKDIFETDFENCINDCPFLEGYVFNTSSEIVGYAMIAKSFSTEFGKKCIWFEDLYLKKEYRGLGIIPQFIEFIESRYSNNILKLEVKAENKHAIKINKKRGFKELPYQEMIK